MLGFLIPFFCSRQKIKIQKKDSKNEHPNKNLTLLVLTELFIIINTFQFFSPPLLLSSSLLLSSVIFVADFCLLLSNNADSKTFGTRNNLGNTKRTAGIIIVIVTHKAYDEINT